MQREIEKQQQKGIFMYGRNRGQQWRSNSNMSHNQNYSQQGQYGGRPHSYNDTTYDQQRAYSPRHSEAHMGSEYQDYGYDQDQRGYQSQDSYRGQDYNMGMERGMGRGQGMQQDMYRTGMPRYMNEGNYNEGRTDSDRGGYQ